MTKSGKRLYEVTDKVMHLFAWVSAGVVLFNFILLCANVFMRYAFGSPIKGTSEIVTMMMAWVAYMGMAYTLLNGKHMQLEAIYEKLQGRTKHIFSFIIYLLATILFVFFVKASFDVFWQFLFHPFVSSGYLPDHLPYHNLLQCQTRDFFQRFHFHRISDNIPGVLFVDA